MEQFKTIVKNRKASAYLASFKAAEKLQMTPRALSRVTSSFMVVGQDKQKINIGLSLKFEGKGMKVVDYTRKNNKYWEYSNKAVELIKEYQVCSVKELGIDHT
jgi:5'-3' exoribonuclease 1